MPIPKRPALLAPALLLGASLALAAEFYGAAKMPAQMGGQEMVGLDIVAAFVK